MPPDAEELISRVPAEGAQYTDVKGIRQSSIGAGDIPRNLADSVTFGEPSKRALWTKGNFGSTEVISFLERVATNTAFTSSVARWQRK